MNLAQRRVLVIGLLIIAGSLLFPPYDYRGYGSVGYGSAWVYRFLWSAPDLVPPPPVNYGYLAQQDLVILAIIAAVFVLKGGKKE
jgi:hypothetical protein